MLLCICTDVLLRLLESSNIGCSIGNIYLGCVAYVDDVCLLARHVKLYEKCYLCVDVLVGSTKLALTLRSVTSLYVTSLYHCMSRHCMSHHCMSRHCMSRHSMSRHSMSQALGSAPSGQYYIE